MTEVRDAFLDASIAAGELDRGRTDRRMVTTVATLIASVLAVAVTQWDRVSTLVPRVESLMTAAVVFALGIASILFLRQRVMGDQRLGWVAPGLVLASWTMYLMLAQVTQMLAAAPGQPPSIATMELAMALHLLWHLVLAASVLGGLFLEHRDTLRRSFQFGAAVFVLALAVLGLPEVLGLLDPATLRPTGRYWLAMGGTGTVLAGATAAWLASMGRRPSVAHAWVGTTLALLVVEFTALVMAFNGRPSVFSTAILLQAVAFGVGAVGQTIGLGRTLTAQLAFERQIADRYEAGLLHIDEEPTGPAEITPVEVLAVLRSEDFEIHFQPIVELDSGEVMGYEALSRFPALRDGTTRPPDTWFAAAARAGLGVDLEIVTARRACDLARHLPPDRYVAINLSPLALLDPRVPALLEVADYVDIQIEVTEHSRVEDYGVLNLGLDACRAAGTKVAIDDAGAGFAGLQHITQLAPDVLKIDLSIVRNVDSLPLNRAMVAALVAYANRVGTTVVAEGIETDTEALTLNLLGVHRGQGFLFGRPAAISAADTRPPARAA